jgi:sensor histidine kinase YesM
MAMSASMDIASFLDKAFIGPRIERLPRPWLRFGVQTTLGLLGHLVPASLSLVLCSHIFGFTIAPNMAWMIVGGILVGFPIIHGTESALRFYRQLKEKEQLEERLRALATQAELKALKAQINPHFLFNTLNTIAALTHSDPPQAEATIERLAEMFRYVLNGTERGQVSLEDELAFVDGYLAIEKARFGDRLQIIEEIVPQALAASIPSLSLQPLVENALRHGHSEDGSIHLTISAQIIGEEVAIAIADRGPGMPAVYKANPKRGIGMSNVDERLRKTYGEEYGLEIRDNVPNGTIVIVKVPTRNRAQHGEKEQR